jgi:hypothetical protein
MEAGRFPRGPSAIAAGNFAGWTPPLLVERRTPDSGEPVAEGLRRWDVAGSWLAGCLRLRVTAGHVPFDPWVRIFRPILRLARGMERRVMHMRTVWRSAKR